MQKIRIHHLGIIGAVLIILGGAFIGAGIDFHSWTLGFAGFVALIVGVVWYFEANI